MTKKKPEAKPKSKPKSTPKKNGRPRTVIDFDKLDKMCAIHCTGEECAALLEVDYVTLNTALQREKGISFPEDRKSTRLNSSHSQQSRMPSSA